MLRSGQAQNKAHARREQTLPGQEARRGWEIILDLFHGEVERIGKTQRGHLERMGPWWSVRGELSFLIARQQVSREIDRKRWVPFTFILPRCGARKPIRSGAFSASLFRTSPTTHRPLMETLVLIWNCCKLYSIHIGNCLPGVVNFAPLTHELLSLSDLVCGAR